MHLLVQPQGLGFFRTAWGLSVLSRDTSSYGQDKLSLKLSNLVSLMSPIPVARLCVHQSLFLYVKGADSFNLAEVHLP